MYAVQGLCNGPVSVRPNVSPSVCPVGRQLALAACSLGAGSGYRLTAAGAVYRCCWPRHVESRGSRLDGDLYWSRDMLRSANVLLLLPVDELLGLQVSHSGAELVAVEYQLGVAKATVVAMEKLTQLRMHTVITMSR